MIEGSFREIYIDGGEKLIRDHIPDRQIFFLARNEEAEKYKLAYLR